MLRNLMLKAAERPGLVHLFAKAGERLFKSSRSQP